MPGVEVLARRRGRNEGFDGLLRGGVGGDPAEGELFAGEAGRGRLPVQQCAFAPGGHAGVGVDGVLELGAQAGGDFAEGLASGTNRVRQCAGEIRQRVDGGGFCAEDVADGAAASVFHKNIIGHNSIHCEFIFLKQPLTLINTRNTHK